MLKTTLLTLLGISFTTSQEVTCAANQVCNIDGNSTLIIRAPKSVPALVINCINKNQCKKDGTNNGLLVYSSANNTYINCLGEDSCEEIELNFGIAPDATLATDYEVTRNNVKIDCLGKQACKSIKINTNGQITKGLNIETSDTQDSTLEGAVIECGTTNACNINCQTIGVLQSVCKDTKCYGNCNCSPADDPNTGCPDNLNVRPTPEPTKSPVVTVNIPPTPEPTPSPVDPRNATACDSNNCVIEPSDNYDVDCGFAFQKCTVNCLANSQCQNGVIIEANSRNVEINCGDINSCDKLQVFGVQANKITINLLADKSGENMLVAIDNPGATVNIIATGDESFSKGKLFCDADCNLACDGSDSCKDASYECLITSDKCTCSGECPTIQTFGDQDCAGKSICTIVASGEQRIVALNNVDKLIVDCSQNEEQCKKVGNGLKIFSAAKETEILCNSKVGCEEAQICVGDLKDKRIPKGFEESEFIVSLNALTNEKQTLKINCDNEGSCNGINLYTTAHVNTKILGDGDNALEHAVLTCDDCESLVFECRDFDGCPGAQVFCPPVLPMSNSVCVCEPIFVEVNLTTTVTETPRDTCPTIDVFAVRQSGIIAQNNVQNIDKAGRAIAPFVVIGITLIFAAAFVLIKCKKSYQTIKDGNNDEVMLKNENIYATYQVEMH